MAPSTSDDEGDTSNVDTTTSASTAETTAESDPTADSGTAADSNTNADSDTTADSGTEQATSSASTDDGTGTQDSAATSEPGSDATNDPSSTGTGSDDSSTDSDAGEDTVVVPAPGSPITPPEGCSVLVLAETVDGCAYNIACESTTITSDVEPSGEEWSTCNIRGKDYFYRFSGIEGLDACAFATNFCMNLPEVISSTPVCEVDIDDTPDGTCQYINECVQPLDLGHGVIAEVRERWTMLSCYPAQTGGEGCGCSDDELNSGSWNVDSLSEANPCELTQSLCFHDEPLGIGRTEGTPGECETEPTFESDIQCQLEEHCTFAKPYGDDTTLSVTEIDTADCTNFDGDEWTCECNASGVRFLRMSLAGDEPSETACSNALDVCRQPTLEGDGPLTCSQILTTEEDECQIDFECEQPIIAGTQSVIRSPIGSAWCYVAQDGWQCDCRYDHTGEEFTLDAPLSPGQACSQATTICTAIFEL